MLYLRKVLSDIALYGGDVQITKGLKRSTNQMEVQIKLSIRGVKSMRFSSQPKEKKACQAFKLLSGVMYGLWKNVHKAIKDYEEKGL